MKPLSLEMAVTSTSCTKWSGLKNICSAKAELKLSGGFVNFRALSIDFRCPIKRSIN